MTERLWGPTFPKMRNHQETIISMMVRKVYYPLRKSQFVILKMTDLVQAQKEREPDIRTPVEKIIFSNRTTDPDESDKEDSDDGMIIFVFLLFLVIQLLFFEIDFRGFDDEEEDEPSTSGGPPGTITNAKEKQGIKKKSWVWPFFCG